MRYEIIYSKSEPMRAYKETEEEAVEFGKKIAKQGYYITIWEIDKKGAKEIKELERETGKEKLPW